MKRFNRRIKKIASLLLVGILATGSLGACGKTSDKEDNKKVLRMVKMCRIVSNSVC